MTEETLRLIENTGVRFCTGEDHGYCCTEDYLEQPDGTAVHRDDLERYRQLLRAMASFRTVTDAAQVATDMLDAGERLSEIWRHALLQMLDDYRSVLRHQGTEAAARMWRPTPPPTGDARVDAAFAALAEHLARRDDWPPPRWAWLDQGQGRWGREARPWWFVSELSGMHAQALVQSPSSFRRRGVFIAANDLDRV